MGIAIKRSVVYFFLVVFGLSALFLSVSFLKQRPSTTKVIELSDKAVSRKILENGFVIFAKERAPEGLVAIDVKIAAGSSLEGEYLGSGISHLVEHMVFKGTPTRKVGDIARAIKSYGGIANGWVSQDFTDFHLTVQSDKLTEALQLLKDMLMNASFEPSELAKEKDVIRKEIRLTKDEPQSEAMRLLNETAYLRHAYKYPVIGYEEIFSGLTRDDLVRYYNRMYVPNRMTIAIVGGVKEAEILTQAEAVFRDFRKTNYGPLAYSPPEPIQIGKRHRKKEKDINLAYLDMAFHSTSVLNEDLFAMDVLSMILGRGNNSRLNTALFKEQKLVYSISCWNFTPRDPGLFVVTAILDKSGTQKAEDAVMVQIQKLKEKGVNAAELETAKRMVMADYIFSRQAIDDVSNDITSNYILTGDSDFSQRYIAGIQAVQGSDIKRVAKKYLLLDNLTVVKVLPTIPTEKEAPSPKPTAPERIQKSVLPNGIRILVRQSRKTPTVSVSAAFLGGLMTENKEINGISSLTARMLLRGTAKRKEAEIEGTIESLGGTIGTFSSLSSMGINMSLFNTDLDTDLDILKDILTGSTFPQEEIDKEKLLAAARIKDEDGDIFQRGINALKADLFHGSPYAMRYSGEEDSVRSLKRDDLVKFYKTYFVPENMVISVSGDINTDEVIKKLGRLFGNIKPNAVRFPELPKTRLDRIERRRVEMPREESLVLIGFQTCGIRNDDRYSLAVLDSVLSGSSGRLFDKIRDKLSLAYTLGCVQRLALDAGYMALYVATTKDKIDEVRDSLAGLVKEIRDLKVGDEELDMAKRELITENDLLTQTNEFFSLTSAIDELYGLGHDNLYRYNSEISKVTAEDLNRAAQNYLDPDAYAEVVISPK